ncbi:MAG: restriction endonuclease subunit S [Candidatus Aureabacteria bacterium]|nr:restriction endonuclease subunit S [Candidatus Auribacterota bacterium]
MAFNISHFGISQDELPSGWSTDRLDSLALFNPEQINSGYPHSQIAYLDISNVGQGVVGEASSLPLSSAPSRAKRIVRAHDSILSTVRPGNRAYAFLREAPENLVVSTGFAVLRARPQKADPRFVYYLATSNPIINYLTSIAEEKTAYPSVNPDDIAECIVPIPPLSEQRSIAHILGTLDDKIELNRQMNETLEAVARALFKSWFVAFDPVRAKAAGRDPGLPKHIADLFPDSFEDSEMGEIPKGWEIKKLGQLLELAYGKALKTDSRQQGTVPVYGSNGQVGWHNEKLVNGPGIVVGRKGNPGIVTWSPTDFSPIDTTFYVVPKNDCSSLHFIFYALQTQDLASLGADSAVPGLNRNLAYMSAQVVPPPPILEKFDQHVRGYFELIHQNHEESSTLADLRDALLPKLISGEIRISRISKRFSHG